MRSEDRARRLIHPPTLGTTAARTRINHMKIPVVGACVLAFVLTACGPVRTTPVGAGVATPSPTVATNGSVDMVVTNVTTDSGGYRVATLLVTVRGPASVNTAHCGGPAPVAAWAVDAAGNRLADGQMYAQYCQAPSLVAISSGQSQTFEATARWKQGSGPITIHGRIALQGAAAGDNLPEVGAE